MKAIILVGGYGTRLRPFTFTMPKPLVPFANKPIVVHQIEALVSVGVDEIILAVNVQPQAMMGFLKECEEKYKIKITCSLEKEPMGTAGPLALAKKLLLEDEEPFFMFNSDVICTFPLKEMLAYHKAHGKEGTIMVAKVTDPSKYGVVVHTPEGAIQRFVEKPQVYVGDEINAGLYILNNSVLDRVPMRPTSIEREVFPAMVADEQLHCMLLPGMWADVGQPPDNAAAQIMYLDWLEEKNADELKYDAGDDSVTIKSPCLIDPTAKIGKGAVIGPHVVVGPDCVIGAGARLQRATLFARARIGDHTWVKNSIIGWDAKVGNWARVDTCYLGEDVTVANEVCANTITVCPHKGVKADEKQPRIIL
eukprot:TRINITY_DN3743_c0_g1_i1.p1 TRINITY_DN3743_c0_g1~~TRINITY_DN3743_c0_g1_i1.p1  ORF type:complete len:364 (-),score=210.05 TRINITY_DN3743_c0_g1_i1:46-1137(-)